jgi:hypothetical protein
VLWRVERRVAQKKNGECDVEGRRRDRGAGPIEHGHVACVVDEQVERMEVAVAHDCVRL